MRLKRITTLQGKDDYMKDYQYDLLQEFREEYEKTQGPVSDENLLGIALISAKYYHEELHRSMDENKKYPLANQG